MKKTLTLGIIACAIVSLLGTSCAEENLPAPIINADQYASLTELIEELKPAPQEFIIEDPTVPGEFTGAKGTTICYSGTAFRDENQTYITTPLNVELTEFLTLDAMVRGNVPTISNQKLLVTGGSVELIIKNPLGGAVTFRPYQVCVQIPIKTDVSGYENDLGYFKGNRIDLDGQESINWESSVRAELFLDDSIFSIYGVVQGYTNCDVLFDIESESRTQFDVRINDVVDYQDAIVWLLIKDFPSAIALPKTFQNEQGFNTYEQSVPEGLEATLLSVRLDLDGRLRFGSLDINVTGDDQFIIQDNFGTQQELQQLIQDINQ